MRTGGVMRGKKKDKYVMSLSELKGLDAERREAQATLKALDQERYGDGSAGGSIDRDKIRKEVRKYDDIIANHTPRNMRGVTKDKLANRAKELRDKIKEGMPTSNEMNDMRRNPGAPLKNLEWEKRNSKNLNEYKQTMRMLEPRDPSAASIERFRRQ